MSASVACDNDDDDGTGAANDADGDGDGVKEEEEEEDVVESVPPPLLLPSRSLSSVSLLSMSPVVSFLSTLAFSVPIPTPVASSMLLGMKTKPIFST